MSNTLTPEVLGKIADLWETRRRLEAALAVLREVEWEAPQYPDYHPQCPSCGGYQPDPRLSDPGGHAPDCALAAVLR
jgi:hypothetical protein